MVVTDRFHCIQVFKWEACLPQQYHPHEIEPVRIYGVKHGTQHTISYRCYHQNKREPKIKVLYQSDLFINLYLLCRSQRWEHLGNWSNWTCLRDLQNDSRTDRPQNTRSLFIDTNTIDLASLVSAMTIQSFWAQLNLSCNDRRQGRTLY